MLLGRPVFLITVSCQESFAKWSVWDSGYGFVLSFCCFVDFNEVGAVRDLWDVPTLNTNPYPNYNHKPYLNLNLTHFFISTSMGGGDVPGIPDSTYHFNRATWCVQLVPLLLMWNNTCSATRLTFRHSRSSQHCCHCVWYRDCGVQCLSAIMFCNAFLLQPSFVCVPPPTILRWSYVCSETSVLRVPKSGLEFILSLYWCIIIVVVIVAVEAIVIFLL